MLDYKKITLGSIVAIALGLGIYYTTTMSKKKEKDEKLDKETKDCR